VHGLKEIFSLREYINFSVVVGHCLVEDVPFCTVVQSLQNFLLFIHLVIRLFLENVTLEMILVIRFPRLGTHVAETFAASTSHKVAACRSFHCLLTPRTDLRIHRYPFGIGFFRNHLQLPLSFLLTLARIVVIALTFKAKYFAAYAGHRLDRWLIYLNAVSTVSPSAELIVFVCSYEHLTKFFFVFFYPSRPLDSADLENEENGLHE
jgi:hypothetical protein